MQKILQNSDIVLYVQFKDSVGAPTPIPSTFSLAYSIVGSDRPALAASFDGTNYKNCQPIDPTTIKVVFDNPKLDVGQLKCLRKYTIESTLLPNQKRDFVQNELIPIYIVQSYDEAPLTHVPENNQIKDHVVVEIGPQGPKGDSSAIDYSATSETIIPGAYWVGQDGTKKPVYYRTFIGQDTIKDQAGLGICAKLIDVAMPIDTLFDYSGCHEVDGMVCNLSEPAFNITVQIINGRLQAIAHCSSAYMGRTLKTNLLVQYTKR